MLTSMRYKWLHRGVCFEPKGAMVHPDLADLREKKSVERRIFVVASHRYSEYMQNNISHMSRICSLCVRFSHKIENRVRFSQ
jgi:hypothetical protein